MNLQTLIDTKKLLVMPEDEYHADAGLDLTQIRGSGKYLANHLFKKFRESPAKFHDIITGKLIPADCYAFRFGRATHSMTLEEKITDEYNGLSPWAQEVIVAMDGEVRSHPFAAKLLENGKAELVARAEFWGFDCQVRLDWTMHHAVPYDITKKTMITLPKGWSANNFLNEISFADLKTCKDIHCFVEDVLRYGYIEQMSLYQVILMEAIGLRYDIATCPVYLIAVEKNKPSRCKVYLVNPEWLTWGRKVQAVTMDALKDCLLRGVFGETFPLEHAAQMPDPPNTPPVVEIKAA